MGKLRFNISISLDGCVAGPNQTEENPLGEGGERLHDWLVGLQAWRKSHRKEGGEVNASTPVAEELESGYGAVIMGRNMFGPIRGPWGDEDWRGWWGEEPPFHTPVFVLTHHARDPVEMEGGTTFHFVTDGIESALERAQEAAEEAEEDDVLIAGGGKTAQQYVAAGLLDEFQVSVVPILLGDGARLLDNLGDSPPELELIRVIDAPGVTHLKYAVR
jgi:dihydrofolate reductase